MVEQLLQQLAYLLEEWLPANLVVFIMSMLPISELRGGIIVASYLGVPWLRALGISLVGNIIPVPFILLFIRKILEWLKSTRLFHQLAVKYERKAETKGAALIEKHPKTILVGLFLFVAIPLPMTGAWTGSLIAAFLNIPFRRSFPVIALGIVGAASVMLTVAYVIPYLVTAVAG